MKKVALIFSTLLIVMSTLAVGLESTAKNIYDPALDGVKQLKDAGAQAAKEGKRVFVITGGNWCKWCRALDRLMTEDTAIKNQMAANFVVIHLNYSKENKNPDAMAMLGNPDKLGFPALVVLSSDLKIVHTQETSSLETGDPKNPGHDPAKVLAFLKTWSTK